MIPFYWYNNFKDMIDENNILNYIKNSNFIEINLKKSLLDHFDKLNQKQLLTLINYFNKQKSEILKMLMSFKNKDICSFEEIKTNLDNINRNLIKIEELQDKQNDENEIYNLIESLS
jgi:hypothetical protein